MPANQVLAFRLVRLAKNYNTTAVKRVKRRLFGIVDHPHPTVTALDGRPQELLSWGAGIVVGRVDESFQATDMLFSMHGVRTTPQRAIRRE